MNGLLSNHIASALLTIGPGASPSAAQSTFGGYGFNQSSLASAIANGDYISFTVAPTPGYILSISSIEVLLGKGSSTATTMQTYLFSSRTGFDERSSLEHFSFNSVSAKKHTFPDTPSYTFLDTVPSLQQVDSMLEFRLYGFSSTSSDTLRIRDLSGADLTVFGSVSAVPEPSSYIVVLAAASFIGALAKRRACRKPSRS